MPTSNESVAHSQTRAHAGIQASKPKKESAEHIEQIAVFFVLYFDVNATYRRYFFCSVDRSNRLSNSHTKHYIASKYKLMVFNFSCIRCTSEVCVCVLVCLDRWVSRCGTGFYWTKNKSFSIEAHIASNVTFELYDDAQCVSSMMCFIKITDCFNISVIGLQSMQTHTMDDSTNNHLLANCSSSSIRIQFDSIRMQLHHRNDNFR